MKRLILIFAALIFIVLAACEHRTCPTYTRKPSYMKELQKHKDVQEVDNVEHNREKV